MKKDFADKNLVDIFITTIIFSTLSQALISIGMGERFNFTATSLMSVMFVVSLDDIIESARIKKIELDDAEKQVVTKKHKLSINKILRLVYTNFANGLEQQVLQKYLAGGLIIVVLVGTFLTLNTLGVDRNPYLVADRQRIVNFLKEENLTVGYGAFWQSLAISGVSDFEVIVIPFHANQAVVGSPLRQGVAYSDFFHNQDRVFLVGAANHIADAYDHYRMGSILELGERHDFPGGWVVYIFDFNPWAEFK